MVEQPLLALWGSRGAMGRMYDVLASWTAVCRDATGHAVDSGHFLPEEAPAETVAALTAFFA